LEKILWLDSETTGIDPVQNDIIQIAGIIEIDGEIKDEFEFKCRPWNPANINPSALEMNKFSKDEILTWAPPSEVKKKLFDIFGKYIDKFNREDKFLVGGHCVSFDIQFLDQFIKKSGDRYGAGSWLSWQPFDTIFIAVLLKRLGIISPVNFKLETLCQVFGVPPGGHDALKDIRVTQLVGLKMFNLFKNIRQPLIEISKSFQKELSEILKDNYFET